MVPLVVLSVATACLALGAGALAWHAFALRRAELDEMMALVRDVERARGEIAAVKVQGRSIEANLREVHASLLRQGNGRALSNRRTTGVPLVVWTDDAG